MDSVTTLPHGTAAWFAMVGSLMCEAATQAALPPPPVSAWSSATATAPRLAAA